MSDVFRKALQLLTGSPNQVNFSRDTTDYAALLKLPKNRKLKPLTERELINLESKIGAEIFGVLPKGHRREFFCLDEATWIWHEDWKDKDGEHDITVRYEVHPNGVLKVQDGAKYDFIEGEEMRRFVVAVQQYYERVSREVYSTDPATGQKIA